MSKVKRVYVEKKPDYAVKAKELHEEIKNYLGIKAEYVRVLVRYDIENISDETYAKALETVFAEPPVDVIYEGEPELAATDKVFSVEALPGQFDQRADSAEQCVKLLAEDEEPVIKTATTYVLSGDVTDEQMKAVMDYCVNPVDSRICGMEIPETLVTEFPEPADVHIFDGFKDMAEADLKELYDSLGLAMTFKDFLHIQNYFKGEEKRDPSMTEIRVLDTYWSDHCRHTTFSTELTDVEFDDGDYKDLLEKTFDAYRAEMKEMYKDRDDKFGSGGNPKHIRSCNRILEKTLQKETGYGKCPSEQNCSNDTGQTDFPDNLIQCGIRLMFCQHAQKIKKRHFHTSDTDIPEKQNDQQSHDHKKRNQIAERSVCFCPGIILFFFYL